MKIIIEILVSLSRKCCCFFFLIIVRLTRLKRRWYCRSVAIFDRRHTIIIRKKTLAGRGSRSDGETDGRGRILFRLLLVLLAGAGGRQGRRRHVRDSGPGRFVVHEDAGRRRPGQRSALLHGGGGRGVRLFRRRVRRRRGVRVVRARRLGRNRLDRDRGVVHGRPVVEVPERTEHGLYDRIRLAGQQLLVAGDQRVVHARRADRIGRGRPQQCHQHDGRDERAAKAGRLGLLDLETKQNVTILFTIFGSYRWFYSIVLCTHRFAHLASAWKDRRNDTNGTSERFPLRSSNGKRLESPALVLPDYGHGSTFADTVYTSIQNWMGIRLGNLSSFWTCIHKLSNTLVLL